MGKFDKLYALSPVWLQNLLVSTYGVYWHWARFSGSYPTALAGYRARSAYNQSDWQTLQHQRLVDVLRVCLNAVPYYRDSWSAREKQAARQGDLEGLPFLSKSQIRGNEHLFHRTDKKPFSKMTFLTSGTTGTPIATTFSLSELRSSLAVREVRSANWAGVSFTQPRATFSGRMVEPDPAEESNVYRYNAAEKQVYFSAFHLKPSTARSYVDALRKHKVVWLTGYSVSYYLLARYILENQIEVPPLKAVITTSEKVTPEMRVTMERAYGCKVYEEYSTVENALFASECEQGRLHVSPDIGIVEILRPDATPCDPGEVGEVVTTCLFRSYQPLVRFRLGDLAAWDPEPCPCGRPMPVLKEVVGRIEDVVTGPDGRQLVRFHGIFTGQPHVIEGQIIQETLERFTVKVVPTAGFSDEDVLDIQARMRQRLGSAVAVQVEKVDSIPRSSSGKYKAVISKVTKT